MGLFSWQEVYNHAIINKQVLLIVDKCFLYTMQYAKERNDGRRVFCVIY